MSLNKLARLCLLSLAYVSTATALLTGPEAQTKLQSIIKGNTPISPSDLAPLWSALPPITVANAIGTYHGGLFLAPNVTTIKKDAINWWGKQIISPTSVNPLLANAPSNSSASGKDESIIFPYPRADIAQARNVEHEGIVSATIMYARLPLLDYLRVVKNEGQKLILLGKSDLRGKPSEPAYFWLEKVEGVKVNFEYKNPYPNTSGF